MAGDYNKIALCTSVSARLPAMAHLAFGSAAGYGAPRFRLCRRMWRAAVRLCRRM